MRRVPLVYTDCINEHVEIEKSHGRIETRRCVVSKVINRWQSAPERWPGLRSIVMLESAREIGDSVTTEGRYYVSSLAPDAARIARAVRSHWSIENGMHWCLDMAFGEGQCRVRVDNAAQNFAILRRIALNLLRRDL